jgi:Protein of unknown function (DUF1353)
MTLRGTCEGRFVTLLFLLIICIDCTIAQDAKLLARAYGEFTGTLKPQPTGDGINMVVLEAYSYSDGNGHSLKADPGFKTDGASIPRALWGIVGSPFTGPYIGAAIIHDVGCDTHKYSWQVTHRMFYSAMRALGVSEEYAKLLYWGVRIGGPKWQEQVISGPSIKDLQRKALTLTGKPLGDTPVIYVIPTAGKYTADKNTFEATVKVPLSQGETLSAQDAQRLNNYIQQRETTKAGAITLDQIDERTPLTGVPQIPQ